jgi:hypothetical protein
MVRLLRDSEREVVQVRVCAGVVGVGCGIGMWIVSFIVIFVLLSQSVFDLMIHPSALLSLPPSPDACS